MSAARTAAAAPAGPGKPSPQESWRQARKNLDDSLRYAPRNPSALELAGLQELRAMFVHPDASYFIVHARRAYENFRGVLAQRPVSAENWANLALAKFYLGQWDAEMLDALLRADQLGRWEYPVQREILFVRIKAWSWLDHAQRAETVRIVGRAAQHNPDAVAQQLRQFNRLDLMCGSQDFNPKVQAICASLRPTAAPKYSPTHRRKRRAAS